jgi:hypothetical protein
MFALATGAESTALVTGACGMEFTGPVFFGLTTFFGAAAAS